MKKRRYIPTLAMPPKGLRPKLQPERIRTIHLYHANNLDAIAKGYATEDTLHDFVEASMTWARVAELLGKGEPEMEPQLTLTAAVLKRYHATGRILFTGPEYQAAKDGLAVMDALAEEVDQFTAHQAAVWSTLKMREVTRKKEALANG